MVFVALGEPGGGVGCSVAGLPSACPSSWALVSPPAQHKDVPVLPFVAAALRRAALACGNKCRLPFAASQPARATAAKNSHVSTFVFLTMSPPFVASQTVARTKVTSRQRA